MRYQLTLMLGLLLIFAQTEAQATRQRPAVTAQKGEPQKASKYSKKQKINPAASKSRDALEPKKTIPQILTVPGLLDESAYARPAMISRPAFPFDLLAGFQAFLDESFVHVFKGNTMDLQGFEISVGYLQPDFRDKLLVAFRRAKDEGYDQIGIFSGYRAPNLGVGGFGNKSLSCHAYGLAVDIAGIGSPGSKRAIRFHQIAKEAGIYGIYGPHNGAEFNHFQAVPTHVCGADTALRKTITAKGPKDKDPTQMWAEGKGLLVREMEAEKKADEARPVSVRNKKRRSRA